MATGFIILKDGRCFGRRWTVYDEILKIAIKELLLIEEGKDLANWIETQIPDLYDESGECGWGFHKTSRDEWINRHLDLRSLTAENQKLFGESIVNGRIKLLDLKEEYSPLDIDSFDIFFKMFLLSEKGEPPLEFSDWGTIQRCSEKNGPGWD